MSENDTRKSNCETVQVHYLNETAANNDLCSVKSQLGFRNFHSVAILLNDLVVGPELGR